MHTTPVDFFLYHRGKKFERYSLIGGPGTIQYKDCQCVGKGRYFVCVCVQKSWLVGSNDWVTSVCILLVSSYYDF